MNFKTVFVVLKDQIVKLERQVDERVEELTKIRLELKRNEAIVVEQAITIQNILAERDNLHTIIDKLSKEKVTPNKETRQINNKII